MNKYCKFLINGLSFHQPHVRFCTTLQVGQVISEYSEKSPKELAEKICNTRHKLAAQIEMGNIPEGCRDCIYKNDEYTDTRKIKVIDLYYWYHCNCGCFYCSYRDITKGEFSDKVKYGNPMIYKTIKELFKRDEITREGLIVRFGGGEIGVLKEFPDLINLFIKNNVKEVWCESSGIKYSPSVEKLLKTGRGGITVAVCAGCAETYKKIKQRDKYSVVMNNLKKYAKSAAKCKDRDFAQGILVSKFIILQGFNDNLEEVEKWLLESKKYGLTCVEISMEFCWGIHTKEGQKVEDYNYKIFDYAEKRCKELGLLLKKNPTSMAIMERGTY